MFTVLESISHWSEIGNTWLGNLINSIVSESSFSHRSYSIYTCGYFINLPSCTSVTNWICCIIGDRMYILFHVSLEFNFQNYFSFTFVIDGFFSFFSIVDSFLLSYQHCGSCGRAYFSFHHFIRFSSNYWLLKNEEKNWKSCRKTNCEERRTIVPYFYSWFSSIFISSFI